MSIIKRFKTISSFILLASLAAIASATPLNHNPQAITQHHSIHEHGIDQQFADAHPRPAQPLSHHFFNLSENHAHHRAHTHSCNHDDPSCP